MLLFVDEFLFEGHGGFIGWVVGVVSVGAVVRGAGYGGGLDGVEEVHLAVGAVFVEGGGGAEGGFECVEEMFTVDASVVEGAGFDEAFVDAAVDGAGVTSGGKVAEVFIGAVGIAFSEDFLCCGITDAFDGCEAEADGAFAVGALGEGGKGFA